MNNVKISGSIKQGNLQVSLLQNHSRFKFGLIMALTAAIITFLIPFSVFLFKEIKPGITFIITLIVFWGSSIYFVGLFLWNKYGEEIYKITPGLIKIIYSYKFFTDGKECIKYNKLDFAFCETEDTSRYYFKNDVKRIINSSKDYYLVLATDKATLISETKVKSNDLMTLFEEL